MRPFPFLAAVALGAAFPTDLAAQCTRLSGVIERDGKSYQFEWDGSEVTVKCGDRVLSKRPATPPEGSARNAFLRLALGTALLPPSKAFALEDEDGKPLGFLTISDGSTATLQVAPWQPARATIDISVDPAPEALCAQLGIDDGGLLVASVEDGGAAAKAGLQRFDVIVALDGERKVDAERLQQVLSGKRPGDELQLTVVRRGEEKKVVVELGSGRAASPHDYDWLRGHTGTAADSARLWAYLGQRDPRLQGLYGDGMLKIGGDYVRYAVPADPPVAGDAPAPAAPTLEEVTRRLAEIEELLRDLEKKAAAGKTVR